MSNICMDTVIFYSASGEQEAGLNVLREAVAACYPIGTSVDESRFSRIFDRHGILTNGLHLRGDIVYTSLEEDHIRLDCDAAWTPMYDAYERLSGHFGVSFHLQAEECGCGIYYNTDIDGTYLPTQYKVCLWERPTDCSLDALFDAADGDTDFYFDSDSELLEWFRERSPIDAATLEELKEHLDMYCVSVHEFVNPYR